MRGTGNLKKMADRSWSRVVSGPALITLTYGYLFWMVMVFAVCSVRVPVDPSLVEPPFRPYCGLLTGVNLLLSVVLAFDCLQIVSERGGRCILRLLPPVLGLASVVCIQLVVEVLRDLRVG